MRPHAGDGRRRGANGFALDPMPSDWVDLAAASTSYGLLREALLASLVARTDELRYHGADPLKVGRHLVAVIGLVEMLDEARERLEGSELERVTALQGREP